MSIDVGALLHLLAHELRAPASVAQGYLRMLRDGRLAAPAERERALAQTQAAVARISALTHEASALADLLETPPPARRATALDAVLAEAVAHAALDAPVRPPRTGTDVPLCRPAEVARALGTLIEAAARQARGAAPTIAVRRATSGPGHELLIGQVEGFGALGAGPGAQRTVDFPTDRGGFGLKLLAAHVVLDAEGASVWTTAGAPVALAVRFPEEEQPA
ncbi:MAG: hypothetical protein AB7O67_11630 [Vicinamibacterales bacterium]